MDCRQVTWRSLGCIARWVNPRTPGAVRVAARVTDGNVDVAPNARYRCYRLQAAGCYSTVNFAAVPASVTPANRIIVAEVPVAKAARHVGKHG
jgi:hypothetical protein